MTTGSPHLDIVRLLRAYGSVEGDFVAEKLGTTVTEMRQLLDGLENAGVIERHGYEVMLKGDSRTSPSGITARTK